MNCLLLLCLVAFNAARIAGEDIEDKMVQNAASRNVIPTYSLIDAKQHVKFWLHAKDQEGYEELNIDPTSERQMAKSHTRFDPKKKTKVIIHGWMVDGEEAFCKGVREAYLKNCDYNVITVDWSNLSRGFYTIASIGTHYIGPFVAEMLEYLVANYGISLDDVHIIGHSLGAHVSGTAGSAVVSGKVGRITGLDPAAPNFFGTSTGYRLNKGDAQFVDVIHTSLLGLPDPLGHADFYPNGGGPTQPGCGTDYSICPHRRAHEFFRDSIGNEESFPALACSDFGTFLTKKCGSSEIVYMGDNLPHTTRGVFYLVTNPEEPFTVTLPHEYYN